MNDAARPPKRSTTHGLPPGPGAALAGIIKQRMAEDPLWQHLSVSGSWICPYCVSAVRGADGTRAGLMRAIESHLGRRCASWRNGAGTPHPQQTIASRRSYEDIAHRAATDPAWQVFDHDGYWYSPSSLKRVTSVRLIGGRFDSFTIQNMVNHLATCSQYLSGVVHPAEAVVRIRDACARVAQLNENLRQLVQYPLWRYADPNGKWICPFCLGHIENVIIRTEQDWTTAIESMAWHIATACSAYSPERPEPKLEALVRQAAAQTPVTTRHAVRTLGSPATPMRSGTIRLATPVNGTQQIPTAAPVMRTPPPIAQPPVARTAPPIAQPVARETFDLVPEHDHHDEPKVAVPISKRFTRTERRASESQPPAKTPAAADDSDSNTALTWMDSVEERHHSVTDDASSRMDTERVKAREAQKNMLAEVPSIPGYRFATRFEACHDISGDFYEFITLPDGRIGFAQGDVSGHGMHAGLIMSMAKKTLEIFAEAGKGPAETLAKVNDALVDDLGGKIFISMTYAILDPGMSSITWARAGHSPAVHYNIHSGEITEVKGKGMVVGMKKGEIFRRSLEEVTTSARTGDVFVVYTDGVTECMNRRKEEYGLDLLFEVVRKHAPSGPDVLLERIMDSLRQFRGGTTADDDITLLAMTVD